MRRRRVLLAVVSVPVIGFAGCLDDDDGGDGPTPTSEPSPVTTTAGGDVSIRSARIIFDDEQGGPRANYRLRNEGAVDATVAVRTVMAVDGGGRYEGTAYVDVPAGDEVVVEYRIVTYAELPDDEEQTARAGRAEFEAYVNGERRDAF